MKQTRRRDEKPTSFLLIFFSLPLRSRFASMDSTNQSRTTSTPSLPSRLQERLPPPLSACPSLSPSFSSFGRLSGEESTAGERKGDEAKDGSCNGRFKERWPTTLTPNSRRVRGDTATTPACHPFRRVFVRTLERIGFMTYPRPIHLQS